MFKSNGKSRNAKIRDYKLRARTKETFHHSRLRHVNEFNYALHCMTFSRGGQPSMLTNSLEERLKSGHENIIVLFIWIEVMLVM